MDTLSYLHSVATYEASANSDTETSYDSGLYFQELDWATFQNRASMPLLLCVITLLTLSLASPSQALEKGNNGSQVTELQKQLKAAGYFDGTVTGYYGSLTQQAVKEFQKAKGITVNGVVDEVTLKALDSSSVTTTSSPPTTPSSGVTDNSKQWTNSTQSLTKGSSSSQVIALQKKLQAAGYFDGPITGYFGSLTQQAVSDFQKAHGIIPDGVADSSTIAALDSNSTTPTPSQPATPPPVIADKPKAQTNVTQVLEKGDKSSQVTSLQKKLQAAGYFDGPITGYYGSLTQQAVIAFQKSQGLAGSGVADQVTIQKLNSDSGTSTPAPKTTPQKAVTDNSQGENQDNSNTNQKPSPPFQSSPQQTPSPIQATPKKPSSAVQKTPEKSSPDVETTPQVTSPSPQDQPQKASSLQTQMKLEKTISGKISPKSIVHSGNGLFFAQNMMYSHTITVYDRNHNLVKTIPDTINLSKYGYSKFKGNAKGAPVEAAFSEDGKYAWVSNYEMFGSGFNNPGSDDCSPSQRTDKSFLYRINTESLNVEKVIQVGSVPKFVATTPDNNLVLVSNWCSWDLSVVDTEKNQEIKRIPLGRYPRGIVVDSDSEKAYIAVMGSYDIATVDLNNFSVGWLRNVGHSPRHLNIDPNDKYLYTTLNGEGTVAKIDLSTGKVIDKVVTGSAPRSMVISDDGQRLYVVNYNSNTVSKVRTQDMKVLQTVNVNSSPIGITYDPQTREVWVACYSGSIMVFQD